MRNGNLLKSRVSEIPLKRIRVNQGVGVCLLDDDTKRFQYLVTTCLVLCSGMILKVRKYQKQFFLASILSKNHNKIVIISDLASKMGQIKDKCR